MASNPLRELRDHGQSVWIDLIQREMLLSGQLRRLIEEDGVSGLTSNPTIFQKAITGSRAYDEQLARLIRAGKSAREIFEALAIEDLQQAADFFRPLYDQTSGRDGYVSMEVSPRLAYDTHATLAEARHLFAAFERPNILIKIPGTAGGLPAIAQCIADGINVNVTLLFSIERYRHVMEAYLHGLERRAAVGQPLDHIFSVASFFISRVDTLADQRIAERLRRSDNPAERERLESLLGRVAIANAKLAYQAFLEVFESARFARLRKLGARVQRPLWASTSVKNPNYRDVLYIESLIGPRTVNTMPLEALEAFRDHGRVRGDTLTEGLDEARAVFERLADLEISLAAITTQLQDEGVNAFVDSYDQLLESIRQKEAALGAVPTPKVTLVLGDLAPEVAQTVTRLGDEGTIGRIWARDATVWKHEPDHQPVIRNRLGWLTSPQAMLTHLDDLLRFGREIRDAGFDHVVLLGMGGSSLAPAVLQATFGTAPGYPDLTVLDSTDPATIRAVEDRLGYRDTLFLVATKSGTTTETLALADYLFARVSTRRGEAAGQHFIAITDPGTPLEQRARERGFRRIFLNPPDIGGRYAALSSFGLVPAALLGVDLERFLDHAVLLAERCSPDVPAAANPALTLGTVLGVAALHGRDKVTLITTPTFATFGVWAEQLLAESTGKEGRGILPVEGEPLGAPGVYDTDRLFVYLRAEVDDAAAIDAQVAQLEEAGQPVVRIHLHDAYDLGAEFFRWELATAVAGALLGVNPFDEPNVTASKDNTQRILQDLHQEGRLPEAEPMLAADGLALFGNVQGATLPAALRSFFQGVRPGDYVALLAYIQQTPEHHAALQAMRRHLRDALHAAVTLGYGPRYLHATGQLHKGGPNTGLFLQITARDVDDLPIPGQPYSFGMLKAAQALGDFQALQAHDRRVIRLHLRSLAKGLPTLRDAIAESTP